MSCKNFLSIVHLGIPSELTPLFADKSRPEYGIVTGNLGPAVGAVGRCCHEDCTQAAHVCCWLRTLQVEEVTDKRVTVHRGLLVVGGRHVPVSVALRRKNTMGMKITGLTRSFGLD